MGAPRSAAMLAAEVLRFQCVKLQKEDGEVGIYAQESGETWIGRGAEGVDVECVGGE